MIFIILIVMILAACIIYKVHNKNELGIVMTMIIMAVLFIMASCWQLTTEEGKRTIKDFRDNASGETPRQVKVYDINGKLIKEYKGRFDIETNHDNYILFDDENGFCHIIYFTTGTVIIDELRQ